MSPRRIIRRKTFGRRRRSISERLLDKYRDRLRRLQGVLAVGTGIPVEESKRGGRRPVDPKKARHWTQMAVKVLVADKHDPVDESQRIPRFLPLEIGRGRRKKRYQFRVDVVALGREHYDPRQCELQSGAAVAPPALCTIRPGHRLIAGRAMPGHAGTHGLPAQYAYRVGTIGAMARVSDRTYLISAGHVIADAYVAGTTFPVAQDQPFVLAFNDHHFVALCPPTHCALPASPMHSGTHTDAVALPLPPELPCDPWPRYALPMNPDSFRGLTAFALVERNGQRCRLEGWIEAVYLNYVVTVPNTNISVDASYVIQMRFSGGDTTAEGDSGAPILCEANGKWYLLGFHFKEQAAPGGNLDWGSYSLSCSARHFLDRIGLELADSGSSAP